SPKLGADQQAGNALRTKSVGEKSFCQSASLVSSWRARDQISLLHFSNPAPTSRGALRSPCRATPQVNQPLASNRSPSEREVEATSGYFLCDRHFGCQTECPGRE